MVISDQAATAAIAQARPSKDNTTAAQSVKDLEAVQAAVDVSLSRAMLPVTPYSPLRVTHQVQSA